MPGNSPYAPGILLIGVGLDVRGLLDIVRDIVPAPLIRIEVRLLYFFRLYVAVLIIQLPAPFRRLLVEVLDFFKSVGHKHHLIVVSAIVKQ